MFYFVVIPAWGKRYTFLLKNTLIPDFVGLMRMGDNVPTQPHQIDRVC